MNISKKNITAIILAGGKGSRLAGQDKGLVLYKGKTLIHQVIERISPQVDHIVINANRNKTRYARYGYPIISDEMNDFQGPLAGFASAMKKVTTDYIITLPCDGPSVALDLVSKMLATLNTTNTYTPKHIVVAHDGERIQPMHALIPITLIDSLETFLQKGDRKISLWYAQQDVLLVDFSEQADSFFNINKKEQLDNTND